MKHSKKIVKDAALGEEPKVDSLRERVYQYLKDAMSAGKLRYGEFLDQDSICETLEVSKTPLRDALIRLEAAKAYTSTRSHWISSRARTRSSAPSRPTASTKSSTSSPPTMSGSLKPPTKGSGNFSKTMTIRNITTKTSVFTAYSCRSPKTSCSNRRSFRCAAASTTSRDASIPTNGSP